MAPPEVTTAMVVEVPGVKNSGARTLSSLLVPVLKSAFLAIWGLTKRTALGLSRFLPLMVITVPAGPESGSIEKTSGGAPAASPASVQVKMKTEATTMSRSITSSPRLKIAWTTLSFDELGEVWAKP